MNKYQNIAEMLCGRPMPLRGTAGESGFSMVKSGDGALRHAQTPTRRVHAVLGTLIARNALIHLRWQTKLHRHLQHGCQ